MKIRRADAPAPVYESTTPFRMRRVHVAAVHCSDGRVGEQIDEFLRHLLGSSLCDRLAVPGGPASLRSRSRAPAESRGVKEQLGFLAKAHGLTRVILIAHVPCAFYRDRLRVEDDRQQDRQAEDLRQAADVVRSLGPITVEAWSARVVRSKVRFYPVPV